MLLAALIAALDARCPDRGMRVDAPRIVFPAAHAAVGDLVIQDDGDEATVFVGDITHHHFGSYDDGLSPAEAARRIADDVADFVHALFEDRVLLWAALGAGGWQRTDAPVVAVPRAWLKRYFVWSRPLDASRR